MQPYCPLQWGFVIPAFTELLVFVFFVQTQRARVPCYFVSQSFLSVLFIRCMIESRFEYCFLICLDFLVCCYNVKSYVCRFAPQCTTTIQSSEYGGIPKSRPSIWHLHCFPQTSDSKVSGWSVRSQQPNVMQKSLSFFTTLYVCYQLPYWTMLLCMTGN